jgi:hypothetical protein
MERKTAKLDKLNEIIGKLDDEHRGKSVVKSLNFPKGIADGNDYLDSRNMNKLRASIAESVRKSKNDLHTMQ